MFKFLFNTFFCINNHLYLIFSVLIIICSGFFSSFLTLCRPPIDTKNVLNTTNVNTTYDLSKAANSDDLILKADGTAQDTITFEGEANTVKVELHDNRYRKIWTLVALRNIKEGEELTVYYTFYTV